MKMFVDCNSLFISSRRGTKTPPTIRNSKPSSQRILDDVKRRRRQSEPDFQNLLEDPTNRPTPSQSRLAIPGNGSEIRPRSEIGRRLGLLSETSDSTDTEARDKKRRFRKRGELDKTKSSSYHNISAGNGLPHFDISQVNSETTQLRYNLQYDKKPSNTSVFSKDFIQAKAGVLNSNEETVTPLSLNSRTSKSQPQESGTGSPNSSIESPMVSSRSDSQTCQPTRIDDLQGHSTPTYSPKIRSSKYQPPLAKTTDANTKSLHKRSSSHDAVLSTVTNLQSPPSNPQSSQMLIKIDYATSNSSNSPEDERIRSLNLSSAAGLSKSKTIPSEMSVDQPSTQQIIYHNPVTPMNSNTSANSTTPSTPLNSGTPVTPIKSLTPVIHITTGRYDYNDGNEHSSDSDFSSSAEMRRLAAKKPELFDGTIMSGYATPTDNTKKLKTSMPNSFVNSHLPQPFQQRLRPNSGVDIRYRNSSQNFGSIDPSNKRFSEFLSPPSPHHYEPTQPGTQTRQDKVEQRPHLQYNRSMSAVYSRQIPGYEPSLVDSGNGDCVNQSLARRGSDGSLQLQEVNSALMPYVKRGQVVYHSAMIQLSLTAEVDQFIHSIVSQHEQAQRRTAANPSSDKSS